MNFKTIIVLFTALLWTAHSAKCGITIPEFNCTIKRAKYPAFTAARLHPSQISVIASLGDSITTGLFMKLYITSAFRIEYRAYSYSNGMQINSIMRLINRYRTLPAVDGQKAENTKMFAYSSGLNFGFTGAGVSHLKEQCLRFVKQIYEKPSRNLVEGFSEIDPTQAKHGWKLVNIWIGANDLCALKPVEVFEAELVDALDTLRAKTNRVFVNLIMHPNYPRLYEATQNFKWCVFIQRVMHMCDSIYKQKNNNGKREAMTELIHVYNDVMVRTARYYADMNDPNFMVAAQSGIASLDPGLMKENNYLSKFDCFHPNECANRHFAFSLWNSMFVPFEREKTNPKYTDLKWYCPKSTDFIQ